MSNEIVWVDIRGYEGLYKVSNYGWVYSLTSHRFKKSFDDCKRGYLKVQLHNNKIKKCFSIHTLVWEHFGDKPRDGRKLQVDHIDENKLNNHIDNLQLLTNRKNVIKSMDKSKTSSKHNYVYYSKRDKKYVAEIKINGRKKYIGGYKKESEAHLATINFIKQEGIAL